MPSMGSRNKNTTKIYFLTKFRIVLIRARCCLDMASDLALNFCRVAFNCVYMRMNTHARICWTTPSGVDQAGLSLKYISTCWQRCDLKKKAKNLLPQIVHYISQCISLFDYTRLNSIQTGRAIAQFGAKPQRSLRFFRSRNVSCNCMLFLNYRLR